MKGLMFAALLFAGPVRADPALILDVIAVPEGAGLWRFDVTVAHPDTGWDHYADAWEVADENGVLFGRRDLLHPHETEQPFTRSLSGVAIPVGTQEVTLRARCILDGWTGGMVTVDLGGR